MPFIKPVVETQDRSVSVEHVTRHDAAACRASKPSRSFTITEEAPTRAFSWLKAHLLALLHLRHYAKSVLTHGK